MKETIKELIMTWLNVGDCNFDDVVEELFNSEMNYNNADRTTRQNCYSKAELYDMTKEAFKEICEDVDNCSNCGRPIPEEDFFTGMGGTPDEIVCTGYLCPYCLEKEDF